MIKNNDKLCPVGGIKVPGVEVLIVGSVIKLEKNIQLTNLLFYRNCSFLRWNICTIPQTAGNLSENIKGVLLNAISETCIPTLKVSIIVTVGAFISFLRTVSYVSQAMF